MKPAEAGNVLVETGLLLNTKKYKACVKQPLLFFSTGYFTYIGCAADTVVHRHHAIQIAISIEDTIEIISSGWVSKQKAVIIDSDEPHECRTHNNAFIMINVDPECKIGKGLKQLYLTDQKIATLPQAIVKELLEDIKPLLSDGTATGSVFNGVFRFLRKLSDRDENKDIDDRIAKVLEVLQRPGGEPLKIKELSAIVYLSPSRLIHLFTAQVGIPIRKYILWVRLLTALQGILESKDITGAALEAGFSDAPHFNRTFKRMFGLAPSLLLKNSQIVQVYAR